MKYNEVDQISLSMSQHVVLSPRPCYILGDPVHGFRVSDGLQKLDEAFENWV